MEVRSPGSALPTGIQEGEMTRRHRSTHGRVRFTSWLLLAGLLSGQLGFGDGLAAVWRGSVEPCCGCGHSDENLEDAAESDPRHGQEEDGCPEHRSGLPCPPGCDDCACCPGVVVTFATSFALRLLAPPGERSPVVSSADPASGVLCKVFRPPETSPV